MKKKSKYKYPLCVFEWKDAQYDSDGSDPATTFKPITLTTVGWLLEDNETEGYVTFCAEYAIGESWVRHKNTISYEMLIEMKRLM